MIERMIDGWMDGWMIASIDIYTIRTMMMKERALPSWTIS
jgi:hypothetical protein